MAYCAEPLTLPRQVDPHHVLADETELLRRLEFALGDLRRLRGISAKAAISP